MTTTSRTSHPFRIRPTIATPCCISAFAILLAPVNTPAATAPRPLNVIFIASDDMNTRISPYGDPIAQTPNLAALARRGVRFDRAYCQAPLCGPSRVSLLSGLRPGIPQNFNMKTPLREILPDVVTLPQLFKNNGYYSARVGKIFHAGVPGDIGKPGLDDAPSWDRAVNPRGRDKDDEHLVINLTPGRNLGSSMSYLIAEGADEEQTDGKVAAETIKLIEQNRERPFFIAAGFYRPHCPYVAPKKYYDLYPLEKISAPPEPDNSLVPKAALASTRPPFLGATPEQRRLAIRGYYASLSFVDAQIGKVIDALDRLGLSDNTIIVFWGDNGFHLGEHGLWQKQSLFTPSARIPLIIAAPGFAKDRASTRPVELVDLYPTLAALAGLKPPANLQGNSLRPLLENPGAAWPHPAFSQIRDGRSIRTEDWCYTEWGPDSANGTELYDLRTDVDENHNLASKPEYREIIAALRKQLHSRFEPATAAKPGRTGKNIKRQSERHAPP